MSVIAFANSKAHGRNGWFKMASASLSVDRGRLNVSIMSKRVVCPGPVFLELSPKDATVLASELLQLVREAKQQTSRSLSKQRSRSANARSG